MKPAEVGRALRAAETKIAAAVEPLPVAVLLEQAQAVARDVRAMASRNGHQIGIAVVERHAGVRVTVRGPRAERYRAVAERELRKRVPDTTAEIRSQVTRKAR